MVSSADSTEISALRVSTRPPTESSAVLSLASAAVPIEPKARSAAQRSRFGWQFIVALRLGNQQAKFRQKCKVLLHRRACHGSRRAIALRFEGRIEIVDELIDGTRSIHQHQKTSHGLVLHRYAAVPQVRDRER